MIKDLPKIYQKLSKQEIVEADYNLIGFLKLLAKIDQQNINNERQDEEKNK